MSSNNSTKKPKDKTVFGLPGSAPIKGSGEMKQGKPEEEKTPPSDSPFVVNPSKRSSYPPPKFPPRDRKQPAPAAAAKAPPSIKVPQAGAEKKEGAKPAKKTILGMPVMAPGQKPAGGGKPSPAEGTRPSPLGRTPIPKPLTESTFKTTPEPAAPSPEDQQKGQMQKDGFAPTMMAFSPAPIPAQQQKLPEQQQPQPQQPQPEAQTQPQPEAPAQQQPPAPAGPMQAEGGPGGFQQMPPAQGPFQPQGPGGFQMGGGPPPGGMPPAGAPPMGPPPPEKKKKSPIIYIAIGCGVLLFIVIITGIIVGSCMYCGSQKAKKVAIEHQETLVESAINMAKDQCEKQIEQIKNNPSIPDDVKKKQIKQLKKSCEQAIKTAKEAMGK